MNKTEFPNTIRYSLYAGLLVMLTLLGLSVASSIWGLKKAVHYLERADHSHQQLAMVSSLEVKINQFLLSQIATTVHFQNRQQLLKVTPASITQALGELQFALEEEDNFIKNEGGEDDIPQEITSAIKIASVFIRMHLAAKHESRSRTGLDSAQAVRHFFANVVEGNDKELSQVVRDIVKGEQKEVNIVKQEIQALTSNITYATTALGLFATLGLSGLALFLSRSILGPVESLAAGADKFGAGQLDFRIELARQDEFGLVANRFNKMAGQLESQQNLLRTHNEGLEKAVNQRTRELEISNDRLRQIDETRRRFFSNVSHELRTPVTVLLGEAEVALRAPKVTLEDLKQAISRIVANGAFLRRRLNDLLSLARSDDGEVKLELKETVLNEVVEEAVDTAIAYARANEVDLEFAPPEEDYIAQLDHSWFRQSILVLIDNAVKFSKPGDTVTVTFDTIQESNDEAWALIEVSDEGPGIEPEALPHLFERYYQAVEGQKREGTGLGLAIAQWILEGHGGEIWAENRPEKGATIKLKVKLII